MTTEARQPEAHRSSFTVFLVVVIGVAAVGYVMGIRPEASKAGRGSNPSADPDTSGSLNRPTAGAVSGVVPARTYAELRETSMGPNAKLKFSLDQLVSTPSLPATGVAPTQAEKRVSLAARSARRAYNGAPPTIPHAVDARSADSCLSCHRTGLAIGDRVARTLPHPEYAQCTQCHVPALPELGPVELSIGSEFVGLPAPLGGSRAWDGAPPTIPHSTRMRDNCLSCHGPKGEQGLRTSHPERSSCTQCHAPSAQLDQILLGDGAKFLEPSPSRERR